MSIFLFVGVALLSVLQNEISEALDESVQTAQDYSIMVDDPYPDDKDPDAWQKFCE